MKNLFKRSLAVLLSAVLLLSVLPLTGVIAFAEGETGGALSLADYTALYTFLESSSVNPRNMGFQSYFPLLPASEGLSYADRAAEEIVNYKEPAKTDIINALSFRTDCTEDEQNIVDGYLAEAKRVFDAYINHNKVDEEFNCTVIDPFGGEGTETAYRNPYTYEYYAENYLSELNIVQKEVTEDGTYVFDVVLSSNYPVATFGFPILINAEKFDIGTVPGTSSSYTTPNTEFFTKEGGFNDFYGYAQDGTTVVFQNHVTATASNKKMYSGRYPEGPGWSAYDDLAFRNKYSLEFFVSGITQSTKSAPIAMSYDNLVIATFAIKLKDGAELDKDDTFMVGDYFIGNQKSGDYGISRTMYTVAKSKNSQIAGPEHCDVPMTSLSTTVTWLAEPEIYTVSFDLNGGTGTAPDAVTEVEGTVVTLPATDAAKTGYSFVGWAKTADAAEAISDTYEITENITLYAVWAANDYTITYRAEGMDDIVKTYTFGADTEEAPIVPAKEGCASEWDKETPKTMPAENILITAVYTPNTYTITYIVDGFDEIVKSYSFGEDTEAAPAIPEKEGFTGAWDIKTPATMPPEDLVITAVYTAIEYTVTFLGVDGKVISTQAVTYGGAATAPKAPEIADKVFTGWDVDFSSVMSDLTVTAQYVDAVKELRADGKYYINDAAVPAYYGLIEYEGDYYYIKDNARIVKDKTVYVSNTNGLTFSDGTAIPKGSYDFDADGKMIIRQGIWSDGKYYINNVAVPAYYGLVEWEGNLYYIKDNALIVRGKTCYVNTTNDLTLPSGNPVQHAYYDFDEDGKLTLKQGIRSDGKYYIDDVAVPSYYGLVEWEGNFYYIKDNAQIVRGKTIRINTTNGLTLPDGTPIPKGNYEFDADGKMIMKQGIQEDGTYYNNGIPVPSYYGLVEDGGYYYYIKDNAQIVRGKTIRINTTNGLTFPDGTPIPKGNYEFDADGRMVY